MNHLEEQNIASHRAVNLAYAALEHMQEALLIATDLADHSLRANILTHLGLVNRQLTIEINKLTHIQRQEESSNG